MSKDLEQSRALWNRSRLDLRSREMVAQILDRGDLHDWRALYALAREDQALRERIARVVATVKLPYGHFWLATLASLGHPVDYDAPLPREEPCV